jgi:acetate kinase
MPPASPRTRLPVGSQPVRTSPVIAALNLGSSSLKFAVYEAVEPGRRLQRCAAGEIDRIGSSHSSFVVLGQGRAEVARRRVRLANRDSAVREFLAWFESSPYRGRLAAIGHRIVHGGRHFTGPQPVNPKLLRALRTLIPLDPDHLPAELSAIRLIGRDHPDLLQVACFDTAFHRTMPRVAQQYALPRRWAESGVIRYGFHGLSCQSIVETLTDQTGSGSGSSRLVVAHLGSGCSMTAIRHGRSQDTTMGFTPTGGLVMATRSGDLDPEVVIYLARHGRQTPSQVSRLMNRRAGLLGVSGTTGDMQDLLRRAKTDRRAREAVELFCYQAQKFLGALTSVLGGLDTLVFTGGIGEHSPEIRRLISEALNPLGGRIDANRNTRNRPIISTRDSRVTIRVIPTDEERVIAAHTLTVASSRTLRAPRRAQSH